MECVLVNLAADSTWLSQVMHSPLLVPSKILMFFIICLLNLSFLLLATCVTWAMISVRASVMLADGAGYALLNGVLGLLSNRFWNNGGLLIVPVCCVAVVVPISGGGVAVG